MASTSLAVLVAAPANAGGFAKATGGVWRPSPSGQTIHTSFVAQQVDGGRGQIQSDNLTTGTTFHGTVDCYEQVDANTARFSGQITHGNVAGFFVMAVQNNGNGGSGGADRVRVMRNSTTPFDCKSYNLQPTRPVFRGNLQVNNPSPSAAATDLVPFVAGPDDIEE